MADNKEIQKILINKNKTFVKELSRETLQILEQNLKNVENQKTVENIKIEKIALKMAEIYSEEMKKFFVAGNRLLTNCLKENIPFKNKLLKNSDEKEKFANNENEENEKWSIIETDNKILNERILELKFKLAKIENEKKSVKRDLENLDEAKLLSDPFNEQIDLLNQLLDKIETNLEIANDFSDFDEAILPQKSKQDFYGNAKFEFK
ncbi:hypothetical protein MHBO_002322 [Bonamia ostreae]|uniref:Uncharacterized protein n=1 Tax=Bonamia ostreae TaxID=126728 RepID=A0ABV2ALY2_9EUKA